MWGIQRGNSGAEIISIHTNCTTNSLRDGERWRKDRMGEERNYYYKVTFDRLEI